MNFIKGFKGSILNNFYCYTAFLCETTLQRKIRFVIYLP